MRQTGTCLTSTCLSRGDGRCDQLVALLALVGCVAILAAGCGTDRTFRNVDRMAVAGGVGTSAVVSVPAALSLDSAGFWRLTPRQRGDAFESPPSAGAFLAARESLNSPARQLFVVASSSESVIRMERLTTAPVGIRRDEWRFTGTRWQIAPGSSVNLASGRTACVGRGSFESASCLSSAVAGERWWAYPIEETVGADPVLLHRRSTHVREETDGDEAAIRTVPPDERIDGPWLAVPAPVGPPAVPRARIGMTADCPSFGDTPMVRTERIELSTEALERFATAEPLEISEIAVAHGVDLVVQCEGRRVTAAAPVLFRRLHHSPNQIDHPWWIGAQPLAWRRQSTDRLSRILQAMALTTAGDPVAAEALLSGAKPTSSRREDRLWARLAGVAAAAGRPETTFRRITVAGRHAWRPSSSADHLLAQADVFSSLGWSRRAGQRMRRAQEVAGEAFAEEIGWFGQWSDLRRRLNEHGRVQLATKRKERLSRADRHLDALAVQILSLTGGSGDDQSIESIRRRAEEHGVSRLLDALMGQLAPISCESNNGCIPDAYARRRPEGDGGFDFDRLVRMPFSILRTTEWGELTGELRKPSRRAEAAILRRRLPWSTVRPATSITPLIEVIRASESCLSLPVFAAPDTWFGAPVEEHALKRATVAINHGCERPVTAGESLAKLLEDQSASEAVGALVNAGFEYFVRLTSDAGKVGAITDSARHAFAGTRHRACTQWHLFDAGLLVHGGEWSAAEERFTQVLNCSAEPSQGVTRTLRRLQIYLDVELGRTTPSAVSKDIRQAAVFGDASTSEHTCAGASLRRPDIAALLSKDVARLWPYPSTGDFEASTYAKEAQHTGPVLQRATKRRRIEAGLTAFAHARRILGDGELEAGLESLRFARRSFDRANYMPGVARTRLLLEGLGARKKEEKNKEKSEMSEDCDSLTCHIARGDVSEFLKQRGDTDACSGRTAEHIAARWLTDIDSTPFDRLATRLTESTKDAGNECRSRELLCRWQPIEE